MFDDIFNGADALLLFALLTVLSALLFPELLVRVALWFLVRPRKRPEPSDA